MFGSVGQIFTAGEAAANAALGSSTGAVRLGIDLSLIAAAESAERQALETHEIVPGAGLVEGLQWLFYEGVIFAAYNDYLKNAPSVPLLLQFNYLQGLQGLGGGGGGGGGGLGGGGSFSGGGGIGIPPGGGLPGGGVPGGFHGG
jgi:hypothetical protein